MEIKSSTYASGIAKEAEGLERIAAEELENRLERTPEDSKSRMQLMGFYLAQNRRIHSRCCYRTTVMS